MMTLKPLAEVSEYAAAAAELSQFRAAERAIEQRISALQARDFLDTGTPDGTLDDAAIAAARRIIAGDAAADVPDRNREIRQLREQLKTLVAAIGPSRQRLNALREELSVEAARTLVKRHRAALSDILDAARTLGAAVAAERAIHLDLCNAGYQDAAHILPNPPLAAALMLGDEADMGSQISRYAEWYRAALK